MDMPRLRSQKTVLPRRTGKVDRSVDHMSYSVVWMKITPSPGGHGAGCGLLDGGGSSEIYPIGKRAADIRHKFGRLWLYRNTIP
jgi:hypothetical protein